MEIHAGSACGSEHGDRERSMIAGGKLRLFRLSGMTFQEIAKLENAHSN
jgi:hypothetical protein